MTRKPTPENRFASEVELCAAFIAALPKGWTAYPETGWDILLVRDDGYQIGIEAKMRLNPHVLSQTLDSDSMWRTDGPDYRAVLVPESDVQNGLNPICKYIGVTIIAMRKAADRHRRPQWYSPELPTLSEHHTPWSDWHEWAPERRCTVPDYVPDVKAGDSAPLQLTDWKIRAIKAQIILEKQGFITRSDFKHLRLDHRRWLPSAGMWLSATPEKGKWTRNRLPDLRRQHPKNYAEIEADFEKWKPPALRLPLRPALPSNENYGEVPFG